MGKFSDIQIKILRGNYTKIGKSCGCSREYAERIIKSQLKHNGKKAIAVIEKAQELLSFFEQ
jgi:hypothetical protein